jgi:hypothetical protein
MRGNAPAALLFWVSAAWSQDQPFDVVLTKRLILDGTRTPQERDSTWVFGLNRRRGLKCELQ